MDNKLKEQITKLRHQGIGYKKIAQELDININSVKSYCRQNGLTTKELENNVCKACQSTLTGKRKTAIFCSKQCRMMWWNHHKSEMATPTKVRVTCRCCGESFQAYPKENRAYCSHECYIHHRFKGEVSHG